MATVVLVGPGMYGPRDVILGPAAVSIGSSLILLSIGTAEMTDPAQFFSLEIEFSFDGGSTWAPIIGCARRGQPIPPINKATGLAATEAYIKIGLLDPSNSKRRARIHWILSGPALNTTGVTLTVN